MHGGNLRLAGELYGNGEFIDLSANINPFGPPDGVWERLKQVIPQVVNYPDPESKALRSLMSAVYSLPEDYIIIGNGAGELIFTILQALKPHSVVIPVPAFSEYEKASYAAGAEIEHVALGAGGWNLSPANPGDLSEFAALWSDALAGQDLVFLCSPHNPTGSVLSREQMKVIMEIALKRKCWVIFDESFYDFLPDERRWSAREYLRDYPNLIVLYSLTKFYSLPGLRLGAAFAQPEYIRSFTEFRDPWSVNMFAQAAGIASLEDSGYPSEVRERIRDSIEFFNQEFSQRNFAKWKCLPSGVNFVLLEQLEGKSGELVKALGQRRILVRDCSNFSGLNGEYVRIAIKDRNSILALLDALVQIDN